MIYEVEVSEQADSDLRGIFEYIAFELQSPENASGQLDRLEEQILSLDTMPERYRKYEKEPWKSRGLRVLPVDNYPVCRKTPCFSYGDIRHFHRIYASN